MEALLVDAAHLAEHLESGPDLRFVLVLGGKWVAVISTRRL
jgi:hypothetical protein